MKFPLCFLAFVAMSCSPVLAAVDKAPLQKWLKSQKDYQSVYAEFVQTRKLSTLRKPLVNKGKMWAKRPDLFLWKMGEPTVVTVLRKQDNYLYLDKGKNEALKISSDSRYARQFEILTGDMGDSLVAFEKRFTIKETKMKDGIYHATFAPVNRQFRKRVPWLILSVHQKTNRTAGFEIHLEDKTVISTQFTRYSLNVAIPNDRFQIDTTGYQIKRK